MIIFPVAVQFQVVPFKFKVKLCGRVSRRIPRQAKMMIPSTIAAVSTNLVVLNPDLSRAMIHGFWSLQRKKNCAGPFGPVRSVEHTLL